jgi:gliding motility-associated-like protein
VDVYRRPVIEAGPDKIIVTGDSTNLDGSVIGTALNYYWSPPLYIDDIYSAQPKVYPLQDMVYTLHATSTVGCGEASDEVEVKVYDDIFIPNSFTPNGDGKNDRFRIIPYENYKLIRFLIYNRWGAVVFSSTDIYQGWDGMVNGQPQQTGTYVYRLELQGTNGKKIVRQGEIVLLR